MFADLQFIVLGYALEDLVLTIRFSWLSGACQGLSYRLKMHIYHGGIVSCFALDLSRTRSVQTLFKRPQLQCVWPFLRYNRNRRRHPELPRACMGTSCFRTEVASNHRNFQ